MENLLLESEKDNAGVYMIYHIPTGRIYIGSSSNLIRRYYNHRHSLKLNKHKNFKLQQEYNNEENKNNFVFSFIEIVYDLKILLQKEQEWMNKYDSFNDEKGYNINPSTTLISGSLPDYVIEKRRQTFLATLEKKRKDPEFKGYNTKPNKGSFEKGVKVWNDGIQMTEEQKKRLRVPKTYKSEEDKLLAYNNRNLTKQNKLPVVYVYDINNNFLAKFNNSWEIQEFSKSENFNLPIIGNFKKNKNLLAIQKITECYNNEKVNYKGLKFSLLPLHQEIDVEKLDNIGENLNVALF